MKDELFISNQRVDLGTDTKITLNFNSNILGDISKIVSSNSYTINLPKTVRNRMILDNPSAPAHESVILRKYNNARYVKNGVEIIKNGNAVLLSVTETFEIALTWGVMSGLQDWINDAKKLSELTDSGEHLTYTDFQDALKQDTYRCGRGYIYSIYDTGVVLSGGKVKGNHPSAYVSWILQKIQLEYGFTIEFPIGSKINELLIPLLNKAGGVNNKNESETELIIKGIIGSSGSGGNSTYTYSYGSYNALYFTLINDSSNTVIGMNAKMKGTLSIAPNFSSGLKLSINSSDGAVEMPYTLQSGSYPYLYNIQMEVKVDEGMYITPFRTNSTAAINYDNSGKPKYIYYYLIPDDIIPGQGYPIAPNLPDIKQIDFLKAICAMSGLFPIADPGDVRVIKLIKIDLIIENKSKALDWSDKLVIDVVPGEPKRIEYKFQDYARTNYLKYKEDDTVSIDADGELIVENETLDRESTLITLPFSPSDGNVINHYKLSDDGLTLEDVNIQDRIMYEVNNAGMSEMSFKGLDFKTLIGENYAKYQEIIRTPIVIKDMFRLTEIDLKELDYTIPVYVKQYGRYHAIIKIQTGDSDMCECDLLQL